MRILHLSTLYPPHVVGGAERSVSMLAEAQVRDGHAVAAACLSPGAWVREERNGVSVYRMPHENNFWMEDWPNHSQRAREWAKFKQQANFAIERHFGAVIDKFAPDLINTHSLVDVSTRVWQAAHRRRVPIVHTLRDFDLLCAASSMFRASGPCVERHLKCRILTFSKQFDQRRVTAVTAVGRNVLERHLEAGFFKQVPDHLRRVIWNTAEVAGAEGAVERDPDRPFTFGYLGRISPEKGVDTLLRAARRLPEGGWSLKIAGAAPGDMAGQRALAQGLPVEFLGFVEPGVLLRSIDVLVVPSLWAEPLGRSVIEAYLMGVPVIGSDTGGIAELIADPAWLVPPGDEPALAGRLRDVLARGRQGLPGPAFYERVVRQTRPDVVAESFQAMYEATLVAGSGASAAPPALARAV